MSTVQLRRILQLRADVSAWGPITVSANGEWYVMSAKELHMPDGICALLQWNVHSGEKLSACALIVMSMMSERADGMNGDGVKISQLSI